MSVASFGQTMAIYIYLGYSEVFFVFFYMYINIYFVDFHRRGLSSQVSVATTYKKRVRPPFEVNQTTPELFLRNSDRSQRSYDHLKHKHITPSQKELNDMDKIRGTCWTVISLWWKERMMDRVFRNGLSPIINLSNWKRLDRDSASILHSYLLVLAF